MPEAAERSSVNGQSAMPWPLSALDAAPPGLRIPVLADTLADKPSEQMRHGAQRLADDSDVTRVRRAVPSYGGHPNRAQRPVRIMTHPSSHMCSSQPQVGLRSHHANPMILVEGDPLPVRLRRARPAKGAQ